jgi:predicted DNA-binding protein (MmcQ/YjbR family)
MAADIQAAVREVCLWLPESEEFVSHGFPNYRVRGRTFASYVVNHHGDGRVALWLNAPRGAQELYVRSDAAHFFVPPYVGPSGWLGVMLNTGLAWQRVADLVREAYEKVAPARLRAMLGATPVMPSRVRAPSLEEIDPFKSARSRRVLTTLRSLCLQYPETHEGSQFGHPAWLVGKKTFAMARFHEARLTLMFWVGTAQQSLLTADPRYQIPPYIGHRGWIALDVHTHSDWREVSALTLDSYRHFALKRMVAQLAPAGAPGARSKAGRL